MTLFDGSLESIVSLLFLQLENENIEHTVKKNKMELLIFVVILIAIIIQRS